MEDKIIWQPSFGYGESGSGFNIILDREFAREMIRAEVSQEIQAKMNQLADERLKGLKKFKGINFRPSPYQFYKKSFFISSINTEDNCVCLHTNSSDIEMLLRENYGTNPIGYTSHNVDMPLQAHTLVNLFDLWIKYSSALIGK